MSDNKNKDWPYPLPAEGRRAKAMKACKSCRQKKQRCDAINKYPNPCARCAKRGLPCELDPENIDAPPGNPGWLLMKANPKRRKVEPITKHLNAEKVITYASSSPTMAVATPTATTKKELTPSSPVAVARHHTPISSAIDWYLGRSGIGEDLVRMPLSVEIPFEIGNELKICNGSIGIAKPVLENLYKSYMKYYHRSFPIISANLTQAGSPLFDKEAPLLFWSMCLVSCPLVEPDLQRMLREHVSNLLHDAQRNEVFHEPTQTMATVLSLCILSYWNIGARSFRDDAGWLYSGMAVISAIQVGFNHMAFPGEGSQSHVESRFLCWTGCLISNQLLAASLGMPFTAAGLGSWNLKFWETNSTPETRQNDLDILQLCKQARMLDAYSQVSKSLFENSGREYGVALPDSRSVIYKSFTSSFNQLIVESNPMSPITELVSLYLRLLFYSIYLLPDTVHEDLENTIGPLYTTCLEIANVFKNIQKPSHVDAPPMIFTLPLLVVRWLIVSALVILYRLLASPYKRFLVEKTALDCIAQLRNNLLAIQTRPAASFVFVVDFVDNLQVMYDSDALSPVLCKFKSRRGASVLIYTAMEFRQWKLAKRTEFNQSRGEGECEGGETTANSEMSPMMPPPAAAATTANGGAGVAIGGKVVPERPMSEDIIEIETLLQEWGIMMPSLDDYNSASFAPIV